LAAVLLLAQILLVVWELNQSGNSYTSGSFASAYFRLALGATDEGAGNNRFSTLSNLSQFLPTLYTFLICMALALQRQIQASKFAGMRALLKAMSAGAPFNTKVDFDFSPVVRFMLQGALLVLLVIVGLVVPVFILPSWSAAAATLCFIACLLYYLVIWLRLPRPRAAWSHAWRCYRQTLGVLLVVVSLLYLLTSAVSLPIRNETNARLDDLIQYGEVQVALRAKGQSMP
jgi:hypothetical protein